MRLTEHGRAFVDREFPRFLERDREMLSALTAREQAQLAALLRKVAMTVESGS